MAVATTKQLTPIQRAAAVVIALGADRASEVYRYLKDEEVEQISLEIAKLNRLSPEEMQSTIEDFYGLCVTQKVINEGGVLCKGCAGKGIWPGAGLFLYGSPVQIPAHPFL